MFWCILWRGSLNLITFGTFCGSQSTISLNRGRVEKGLGREKKKKKNPSLRRDISHPSHLRSMMEMGIMLCLIFWWHGWNAVISYLGHNSAKLKNRRAQKHRRKKKQGCKKKKKEKKRGKMHLLLFSNHS